MLTAEDRRAIEQIVEAAVAKAIEPLLHRLEEEAEEYIGPETRASLDEVRAAIAAGEPMLTTEELLAELGLSR